MKRTQVKLITLVLIYFANISIGIAQSKKIQYSIENESGVHSVFTFINHDSDEQFVSVSNWINYMGIYNQSSFMLHIPIRERLRFIAGISYLHSTRNTKFLIYSTMDRNRVENNGIRYYKSNFIAIPLQLSYSPNISKRFFIRGGFNPNFIIQLSYREKVESIGRDYKTTRTIFDKIAGTNVINNFVNFGAGWNFKKESNFNWHLYPNFKMQTRRYACAGIFHQFMWTFGVGFGVSY